MVMEGDLTCRVKADFEKMKQVLFNLLKNAILFSKGNAPVVIKITRQSDLVNIQIKDQGIGISSDTVPLLFQKYFREDNEITREIEGNGLGLFLAKSYIGFMKGTLYCETEKGKGSVFTVTIPAV
jgi:signal transduction histidine kinase